MNMLSIKETLSLGIDLGIGSCGWALLDTSQSGQHIVAMGSRCFDVPETDKERKPKNQIRRQFRGMRRVLRRRAQRMAAIRRLFHDARMLPSSDSESLKISGLDPWQLRVMGLDRLLTPAELAVALGHIARHRGFKSNSKSDSGNEAPADNKKMLSAIEATRQLMTAGDYRTIGELIARHPDFTGRKRNRDGDYSHTLQRDDQLKEVQYIFDRQRAFGNPLAATDLMDRFIDIAFFQRPLADSDDKVGICPLSGETRTAKYSPSFERFRMLSRLTALNIQIGRSERRLTSDEIRAAMSDFGAQQGMTFKRLRKLIELPDGVLFEGIPLADEGKRDVVARSGAAFPGTYALRQALGAAWSGMQSHPEKLDRAAEILTFREDIASIRVGLSEIGFDPLILEALMLAVERGSFARFKGAAHISATAARAMLPHLMQGMVYSVAASAAGYTHTDRLQVDPKRLDLSINNPIARRSILEAYKQVKTLIQRYGVPGRIHVEMARDVGKSLEERNELKNGIEKRNKEKDRLRTLFMEATGRTHCSGEDLLRYELWREQNGRCLYTDQAIPIDAVVSADNRVQVDHILPWSRSGDDSFVNKTLCFTAANQAKKGQTPFEWLGNDETRWALFSAAVEACKMKGRKKRNYVLKDASVLENKFRERNLNDTRHACRVLLQLLAQEYYPDYGKAGSTRRLFARPGALTDRLRRGWGIQGLKKDEAGQRIADDRHHALDAAITAACSEPMLQELTRAFQEQERLGSHRDFSALPPPWPGFREQLLDAYKNVRVSRSERRRARGEAHGATIRQIEQTKGPEALEVVYERKAVAKLTNNDLDKIKDLDRNAWLRDILADWIARGKPENDPPRSPKGDAITKVRVATTKKVDVLIRDGAADRGEMARVDVFRKKNPRGKWEFYLVPIYPHQVADQEKWPVPPNKAVTAHTPEEEWPDMTAEHEFIFSLYPMSYLYVVTGKGEIFEGYFRGMNRATGALKISAPYSTQDARDGIGARTLLEFRKFNIDRFGDLTEIVRETRTWHGAVCTSADLPA